LSFVAAAVSTKKACVPSVNVGASLVEHSKYINPVEGRKQTGHRYKDTEQQAIYNNEHSKSFAPVVEAKDATFTSTGHLIAGHTKDNDIDQVTLSDCVRCLLACCGLHFVVNMINTQTSSTFRGLSADQRLTMTQNIVCVVVSAALVLLYGTSMYHTWATKEERWTATTKAGNWGLLLHCCHCIYETVIYIWAGKPIEFFVHHAVVLLNFGLSLYTGQMQFFACWDGLVEITNLSCCVLEVQRLQKYKGVWYTVNGAMLWILFLAFRVINLPLWMHTFTADIAAAPHFFAAVNPVLKYSVLPSTFFVWALSCFWFYKITRGMLKALGFLGNSSSKNLTKGKAK